MRLQHQLSNGSWVDATGEKFLPWLIEETIKEQARIAKFQKTKPLATTGEEIYEYLKSGKTLSSGRDWYEKIRDADSQPKPKKQKSVLCDCGHYTTTPMNSSTGRVCPDCYDRYSN